MFERLRMAIELFEDVFRVVCFIFFVGIVFFQSYKKLFPYLSDLYQKYKYFLADKVKLREKISRHKEVVLQEIEKQHAQGLSLTEKIIVWSEKEQRCRDQKNQEEQRSREMLKNYMMEQSHSLAFTTTRKELIPEITSKVIQEIDALYASSDEQKKYTTKVLAGLGNDSDE